MAAAKWNRETKGAAAGMGSRETRGAVGNADKVPEQDRMPPGRHLRTDGDDDRAITIVISGSRNTCQKSRTARNRPIMAMPILFAPPQCRGIDRKQ